MIDELGPYSAMKDSGAEWLGEVPVHWKVVKLRRYNQVFAGATPSRAIPEYWDGGTIPWLASGDVNLRRIIGAKQFITQAGHTASSTKWIRPRSLVLALAGQGRTKGMVATIECWTTCNQSLAAIEPSPRMSDHNFLAYYLQSRYLDIRSLVGDGLRDGLNLEHVRAIPTPLPPLPEQTAITRFLDHTTSKIECYIRAKEKLISLLEEQKQAIIHQAVTGQIDVRTGQPYPAYKPSGVEWLGNVPVNWEIQRAKRLFSLRTEKSGSAHGLELLSIYTHIGVRPRKDLEEKGNKASTTDDYWIVKPGDLITNKLLAWMGAIGVSHYYGVTSPAYDILMPIVDLESDYYHLLFRTPTYLQQFKQYSRGIMDMRLRLYFDQFGQIPVTVPRIEDQQAIVEFCDKSTIRVNDNIQRTIRQVDLLREYRTRLIADVITGKVDVREAAAELPQIDSETHEYGENSILSEPHSLNTRHDKEQEARL
ncbi:restriction endonuclease subunit S [Candidatus Poribacteria bacterium]|nr:restriction endonuclease subunit S [Candidatus Poribacteria bacterium]